jgi:LDH2 family malate/lactate/ureidoglycolate dehydrogenase
MSAYPDSPTDVRVSHEALRDTVTQIFRACAMSKADAVLLADSLTAADLSGLHSHGCLRAPEYVKKLTGGGVDPEGRPQVVSDRGSALVVDGGNSMGQIGAAFAMRKAIERAGASGVAVAAVRGSNHCGALSYYVKMAAAEGMIGLAATNALPTMAPWGGLDKIIGINPLGVAIPAHEEPDIVFDAAFAGSSHGKIRVFQQKGLPIPPTWAFDRDGNPTTDAATAVQGLLQPIGEHKGVGLAMVWGLLSTLLSGSAYGTESGDMVSGARPGADGHILIALNVSFFCDPIELGARVDAAIRQIRNSRRRGGVERLYSPGELEHETERRYRREGIPLSAETINGLRDAVARFGLSFAL